MPDNARTITIEGFEICDPGDCYVIAEIGHNHQGSVEQAKRMFDEARSCGAHAVKIQKRDNRALYTEEFFNKPYENENSFGPTYGLHREALEFDRDQYAELRDYAREIGVTFFSTAFDHPSADLLAELDMPAYKIASGDLTNTPLIRRVAEIGKPMILSTGGAILEDVRRAHETATAVNKQVAILQCTAEYPARWDEMDLKVIQTYRDLFPGTVVGLSSHDNGISMPVAAYCLGGRIVEKHFTLDRAMKGTDHRFSLEPQGMRKLVRDLKRTRLALGDGIKKGYSDEVDPIRKMGKSLVAATDLPAGHTLTAENVAAKSPGGGLPPYELDRIVGCRLNHPVGRDNQFTFEVLDEVASDGDGDDDGAASPNGSRNGEGRVELEHIEPAAGDPQAQSAQPEA